MEEAVANWSKRDFPLILMQGPHLKLFILLYKLLHHSTWKDKKVTYQCSNFSWHFKENNNSHISCKKKEKKKHNKKFAAYVIHIVVRKRASYVKGLLAIQTKLILPLNSICSNVLKVSVPHVWRCFDLGFLTPSSNLDNKPYIYVAYI